MGAAITTTVDGDGAAGTGDTTTTTIASAATPEWFELPVDRLSDNDVECLRTEAGPVFEDAVTAEWIPGADDIALLFAAIEVCGVGNSFSRTECVYRAGADSDFGDPGEFDGGYFGTLTDGGETTGVNRGLYGLGQEGGTRTIRGTLAIRDDVMGEFDGRFQGRFGTGFWQGQGWAAGRGDNAGALLVMGVVAFDYTTCPRHPDYGFAIDGTIWDAVIVGP